VALDLFRLDRNATPIRLIQVRELSAFEAATFREAHSLLTAFVRSRDIFPVIRANASDVERARNRISEVNEGKAVWDQNRIAQEVGREVSRSLVNFLTAMRLYLDHTQTRLSRWYSTTDAVRTAFKCATSLEFDNHAAYRILYKLRNYVQHCGLPINVSGASSKAERPGAAVVNTVRIGADVAVLLRTYDGWGLARKDLELIDGLLEPHLLVGDVLKSLDRIEDAVLDAEEVVLRRAGADMVNVLRPAASDGCHPVVVEVLETGAERQTDLTMFDVNYRLLNALGLIQLAPDGRPIFDP
jgi:hypothetical protein